MDKNILHIISIAQLEMPIHKSFMAPYAHGFKLAMTSPGMGLKSLLHV